MKHVLLVEDNAANRKLMGDHLRRAGYHVLEAVTAVEALELAAKEPVNLVVMDIQLPGLDGVAATKLLRKDPKTAHLPVLAVTAHAMRDDEDRILAAGACAYLAKPIDYRGFLALVQDLMAKPAALEETEP